jgi:hypothetical protein
MMLTLKSQLFQVLIATLLLGCAKPMIQVFETSTTDSKLEVDNWVYESDTVRIVYGFWTEYGVMAFSIYNKLEIPIYVDWKNSSFIYNGVKLDYWIDEQKAATASYGTYQYKGPSLRPGYSTGSSLESSKTTSVKPERITFIPPKSIYPRSQFYLHPELFPMTHSPQTAVPTRNYLESEKTDTIFQMEFTAENSPLKFRNFLAIKLSETSDAYYYIDNEFYLSAVKEMNYRTYQGIPIGWETHTPVYGKSPYEKETSFFIPFKK